MIRPLSLYIGLRYTRAKRRNRFISFISFASILGIALGVTVLITVLSVMNGFDYQIKTRFFAIAPQVTLVTQDSIDKIWPSLQKRVEVIPGVSASAPYINGKGMLINSGQLFGVEVLGVVPSQEIKISELGNKMVQGRLTELQPGRFNIVIGQALATNLGVVIGDKINLFTPQSNITPLGAFPVFKPMTVSGIFHSGNGFGFENSAAYINFIDAEKLFPPRHGARGLHVKLENLYHANSVSNDIQKHLPSQYYVTNWTQTFGAFFQALNMEKTILFVILLLIVAVAAFNLVSTLVMVVNDKAAEIAILRTLGASPGMIMRTFIVQGAIIGLLGTVVGLLGGLLLAYYVTPITNWIQQIFHVQFVQASVYFLDYLPSKIEVSDVIFVCVLSFLLSLIATIYPAFVAFRTQPAEALRYD